MLCTARLAPCLAECRGLGLDARTLRNAGRRFLSAQRLDELLRDALHASGCAAPDTGWQARFV